jgi:hypothetical protein
MMKVGVSCMKQEKKRQSVTWLSPKDLIAPKLKMQNSRVKTLFNAFIHHEIVPEKQIVYGKFYK